MILATSSTERTMTRLCDVGIMRRHSGRAQRHAGRSEPAALLRSVQPAGRYQVPFQTALKFSGSYPVPFGIQVSATFTDQPGRGGQLIDINTLLPITWLISRTTRYTAEQCAGRPCTAGDLVIPGLVQNSVTIPLVPSGTVRLLERQRQLNIGVRKTFRTGRVSYGAEFDLYNALNADTVLSVVSNNFGTASYDVPQTVLAGRMPRIPAMTW